MTDQQEISLTPAAQAYKASNPESYSRMLELFDEETLSQILAMPAEEQMKMLLPISSQQPED